ncbi:MAG: BamA/TamA family outer membrane protein [FCB group bacterium]|nr:BamA/TamA family outer membrane protein [FCB group bacterium]
MPAFRNIAFACCLLLAGVVTGGIQPVKVVSADIDDDLRRRIEQEFDRSDGDKVSGAVLSMLSEAGYLNGRINSAGDTIVVEPGSLYNIGDIYLNAVTPAGGISSDTLKRYRGFTAGKGHVERFKADILESYQAASHYFASINVDRVEFENRKVHFHLKLITGPEVTIERMRFYGLHKSDPEFISRLSGLRRGDPFVQGNLEKAVQSLQTTGFLRNDSMPQVLPNENYDRVELLFYLKENKSSSLELGGGYLPGQGSADGEFVGRMHFRSRNLFGAGRSIELLLDRKDRASSVIELRFGQPFFIPDHLELTMHARQVDYDSSYHSFSIDGGLSLFTGAGTKVTGGGSWTKIEPQKSSQASSRLLTGDLSYQTDNFDYAPNPSTGRQIAFGLSYIRRISHLEALESDSVNNESRFNISLDSYMRLSSRLVLRINLKTRVLITSRDLIDLSEQFKLGGFSSLRGYRQDQFAGRRTALGQVELRLRPSPDLAAYLFADLGYVYAKKEILTGGISSENLSRAGSGLGLFIGGDNARMTLELGWGRYDRFDDGKIHLGLTTLF